MNLNTLLSKLNGLRDQEKVIHCGRFVVVKATLNIQKLHFSDSSLDDPLAHDICMLKRFVDTEKYDPDYDVLSHLRSFFEYAPELREDIKRSVESYPLVTPGLLRSFHPEIRSKALEVLENARPRRQHPA